jgi:peptidoglycan-associated lipoprotein
MPRQPLTTPNIRDTHQELPDMIHKHRFLAIALAAATLAGCGSTVKLDDVPVEDARPSNIGAIPPPGGIGGGSGGGGGAAGSGQARAPGAPDPDAAVQTRVAPVAADAPTTPQQGPVGFARIVYFDYDSFAIRPEFQPVIEAHARHLRADGNRRVVLEGHTDDRGGREYNLALGQQRAEAIRRALTLLGVQDGQLEAVSFGKEKLAVTGNSEDAHARNRRVELTYRR